VKVRADSRQNDNKTSVLLYKTGDFVKLCQISSKKLIISPQGCFLSVFLCKRNSLEPSSQLPGNPENPEMSVCLVLMK